MYHNGITYFEIYKCMRCITFLDRYFCQIARVNWTEFLSSWSQMKLKMIISGTEFVERDLLIFCYKEGDNELEGAFSLANVYVLEVLGPDGSV